MASSALRLLIVWLGCLLSAPALALDPGRALWQYGHTAWRVQDGELPGVPNSLAQSEDGYLWVGTNVGPIRFDGRKFSPLADASGQPLLNETVLSLLSTRDGSLWIATAHGGWYWREGQLKRFDNGSRVNWLSEDANGAIWFSRSRIAGKIQQPMGRVSGGIVRYFGASEGVPGTFADGFAIDRDGSLWIGTVEGVLHWNGQPLQLFGAKRQSSSLHYGAPQTVQVASDGSVWAGFSVDGSGFGLRHLVGGELEPFALSKSGTPPHVQVLFVDRRGVLWVGTIDHGLYRISGGHVDHLDTRDGLSGDGVNALAEDKEGNIWVGTSAGLDRFRDLRVNSLSSRDGIASNLVHSLSAAPDGSVWISDLSTVQQLWDGHAGRVLRVGEAAGGNQFSKVFVDRSGRIWAGVDDDLAVLKGNRFQRIRMPDGGHMGVVVDIVQDASGDVWATSVPHAGFVVRVTGDHVAEVVRSGFSSVRLLARPDGSVWASTSRRTIAKLRGGSESEFDIGQLPELTYANGMAGGPGASVLVSTQGGLAVIRGDRLRLMTIRDGLPCQRLFGLAVDRATTVWLYGSCGVMRLTAEELDAWWAGAAAAGVHPRLFDASDGAQPDLIAFGTSGAATKDGHVWFANGALLQVIDPSRVPDNAVSPKVHIESVAVNHRRLGLADSLTLPANLGSLEIDYTATSFVAPQKVQFRYLLEGHDLAWQDAGTRREALYTDLKPGNYRFHVTASNNDGLWNDQGASIDIVVPRTFVQSRWFIALCIALATLLLWLGYAARMRQVRLRVQAQVGERERIAVELHDTLLQGAQGLVMVLDGRFRNVRLEDDDREALNSAVARANDLVREGRDRIQDLRMPFVSSLSLFEALQGVGESFAAVGTARFSATLRGEDRAIAGNVNEELRRLVGEAMSNAFRHARASAIELDMLVDARGLVLTVRDNGIGIDPCLVGRSPKPGHWGLVGMRQRASRIGARLDIGPCEKTGTLIRVAIGAAHAFATRRGLSGWHWLRMSQFAATE